MFRSYEKILKSLSQGTDDIIFVIDENLKILDDFFPENQNIFAEKSYKKSAILDILPISLSNHIKTIFNDVKNGEIKKFQTSFLDGKRSEYLYQIILTPYCNNDKFIGFILIIKKLIPIKDSFRDKEISKIVFNLTQEGIFVTDRYGWILSINNAFKKISGFKTKDIVGKHITFFKNDKYSDKFYYKLWKKAEKKGRWEGELWNIRKDGEKNPYWVVLNRVSDNKTDEPLYFIGVINDISEIKKRDEEIFHQKHYDPLTGLPNKGLLLDRLQIAIENGKRRETIVAIMFLDLDHFKKINDSLGHTAGDNLLQAISKKLAKVVKEGDTVARISGDDFVIILSEITDILDVVHFCEKIINMFQEPNLIKGKEVVITPSIGISLSPSDGNSAEELLKYSDMAMFHAKKKGRNNFAFYSKSMNDKLTIKMEIEAKLRKAIERDQFVLHYQPVIDVEKGIIHGAEALIRWQDPDKGFLSPAVFIPLAEETNLITDIDIWVLEEASKQNKIWQKKGLEYINISINITAADFKDKKLLYIVNKVIKKTELAPLYLNLEITENSLMKNREEITFIMKKLKRMGVKFSIDDFGTGYSSLNYLKNFPINILKIDRSFVTGLPKSEKSCAIAKAIIALAKALDLDVIAEGVETIDQLLFLKKNGCRLIQGYYLSKPLPAEIFEELLSNYNHDDYKF